MSQESDRPRRRPARRLELPGRPSLLVIDDGPFNYIPVAPEGFKPGRNLCSAGYDNMAWPITMKAATILLSQGDTTYTKEKPWHGRSEGRACDVDANVLIGVVQGYEVPPWGKVTTRLVHDDTCVQVMLTRTAAALAHDAGLGGAAAATAARNATGVTTCTLKQKHLSQFYKVGTHGARIRASFFSGGLPTCRPKTPHPPLHSQQSR